MRVIPRKVRIITLQPRFRSRSASYVRIIIPKPHFGVRIMRIHRLILHPSKNTSRKKMLLIFFQFFLISGLFSTISSCPLSCYCTEDSADCIITSCSVLEFTTAYDLLSIRGSLCPNQRSYLEEIVDDTMIVLLDDHCDKIPNCR